MASHPSEGYNLAFRPKSAAVSKGYSFASSWEQNAPLTEEAHAAVISLSHAVAERPFPLKLSQEQHVEQENVVPDFRNMSEAAWPTDAVLVNSHEFYKWFTDLESATKSEWEEKYRQYVSTLKQRIQTCDEVLSQVDSTLNFFNELQLQQQAVAANTKTLHDACEQLLDEKKRLTDFAEAICSKLNYFDELENVATEFYSPSMNVGNQRFLPLLKRLDECILYVESNPQYAESGVYLVKFQQVQSRALSMVRSHVLSVLKNASSQVTTAIKETGGITTGVEASVLYVRFKASAGELRPVMEELESRASRKEYTQLLSVCQQLYCEQRLSLIKGIVQQKITEFSRKELLPQLTRSGCAYLMEVCQLENRLFDHFFPSSTDAASLAPLIDPLCTYLYDTLRPKLIHEANLDFLCDLIDILKVEVLGEQPGRRVESVAGIQPTVLRILADVHERLIFRAQTYVRNEIANYIPFDEDLDYPAKLEKLKNSQLDNSVDEKMLAFSTWYSTLQKTLTCLEKLYHRLEPTVFTGLAQEVVDVCSTSIQKASKLITKRSSTMDGQLFLIKHLLILRDQIANFEIEFSVTHKELDFAHLLEHLRRLLRGQASLFDWSRSSSLARTLSPRVLENQIDVKKELEKCLKATCEEFIMSVTKIVVDPMLSFVTKVTAVKVALSSGNQAQRIDSVLTKPLKDQAFASPEKVSELVQKVDNEIRQELPKVMEKMKLYLQNPSTRAILFKPIKANILEAHIQIHKLIESEYTPEEAKSIGMVNTEELQEQLERNL